MKKRMSLGGGSKVRIFSSYINPYLNKRHLPILFLFFLLYIILLYILYIYVTLLFFWRYLYLNQSNSDLSVLNWIIYCKQRPDYIVSLLTINKGYRALRYHLPLVGRRPEF